MKDLSYQILSYWTMSLLLFVSTAMGQAPPATTWTRTAFEAGVSYGDSDQIAITSTNCPSYGWAADWYGHSISWSTNGASSPIKDGAPRKSVNYNGAIRTVVFNGSYPVYANSHVFETNLINKTVTATITLRLHCLDGGYTYMDYPSAQQLSIFDRILIDTVGAPTSIKGGAPLSVEIFLTAPAPASNTRVDMKLEGGGLDLLGPIPCEGGASSASSRTCHIDVGAGAVSIKFVIPTVTNTGLPKQVVITATAKPGISKRATVSITR